MSAEDKELIEALARSIEKNIAFDCMNMASERLDKEMLLEFDKTFGNQFAAYLGIDFIDDIKRSIVGKVHIVDHSTLTIACIDGKKLTFVIKPKEGCIEVVFPELDTGAKKGRIEMKRQSRAGVLKPKFAHMWKSYITLTYAKYNVAHS